VRFVNDTPDPASLFRTERDGDVMANAAVVRVRRVLRDGKLEAPPADLALSALRQEPVDLGDYGELEPDALCPRTGTDVIVIGDAICPEPRIATRVEVHVGDYHVSLDVYGDRVWESVMGSLVPSEPQPFMRKPLTLLNTYGGAAEGDYGPIPWRYNPVGKGYYLRSTEAKDKPLPNVVFAGEKLAAWDDRPVPATVGPYPNAWALRMEKVVSVDEASHSVSVDVEGGIGDRAHPMLSGKQVEPGKMKILGMTERGVLELDVPPCPYEIDVTIGDKTATRKLSLEEIFVDLRSGIADFTYRKMFRYAFVPHQRRMTVLRPVSAPS
jgi:hypothetical protein